MRMEIRFYDETSKSEVLHVDASHDLGSYAVTFAEALGGAGASYTEVLEALEHALIVLEEEALEAVDYMNREEQG